jgi:tetrahydromethanopterin S-methyltransferase subunit G
MANNEMRDLLIRLDQRVTDGFQQLNSKLDTIERRADGHENRILALEALSAKLPPVVATADKLNDRVDELERNADQVRGGFAVSKWVWIVLASLVSFGASQLVDLTPKGIVAEVHSDNL